MNSSQSIRVLVGLLFLAIGVSLFMNITGWGLPFDLPSYLFSWKTMLIVLGLFFVVSDVHRGTGVVLIVVGAVFLTRDVFQISPRELFSYAIPVLFVLAGIFLLFPRFIRKKKTSFRDKVISDSGESLDAVHIFSSGSRQVKSETFCGGELLCVFGGANVHFRDAKLQDGKNILHVTSVFGGCELYVPDDWVIRTEATTVFADFSDKRFKNPPESMQDENKVLIIKGFLLFSGLEIKSS